MILEGINIIRKEFIRLIPSQEIIRRWVENFEPDLIEERLISLNKIT